MTIRGDVSVKDEKGHEISRLEDGKEMQVENERTILIKNVKGVNIVKISKGDTWIKNHGIDEKVSVGNNRVTIANAEGVLMVEVKDGEISVQDFDGEVIVKNMEMVFRHHGNHGGSHGYRLTMPPHPPSHFFSLRRDHP